jgi:hypothetical protein
VITERWSKDKDRNGRPNRTGSIDGPLSTVRDRRPCRYYRVELVRLKRQGKETRFFESPNKAAAQRLLRDWIVEGVVRLARRAA